MDYAFYIAATLGAVAVYLSLPHERSRGRIGALVGMGTLGLLLIWLLGRIPDDVPGPGLYYYAFTLIAVAAAVRVITHTRPIYSALYFILVVLSSAGMLVLLEAEFMAFAMVIIYAGAILVTYLFVIMLATLPETPDTPQTGANYDRVAREPMLAVAMGFVLLAVLCNVIFGPPEQNPGGPPRAGLSEVQLARAAAAADMARRIDLDAAADRIQLEVLLRARERSPIGPNDWVHELDIEGLRVGVRSGSSYEASFGTRLRWVDLELAELNAFVGNIDYVGLDLFRAHPLGIELAGVILLLAMVGAIVIARRRVPDDSGAQERVTDGAQRR